MLRTITVAQLRAALDGEDDDALVVFTADYGDYHHTPQALPLRGLIDEATISESGYSHSGYQLDTDDDPDPAFDAPKYLVIR